MVPGPRSRYRVSIHCFDRGIDNGGDVLCVLTGRQSSLHQRLDGRYLCGAGRRVLGLWFGLDRERMFVKFEPLPFNPYMQWGATLIPLWILEVALGIGAVVMSLRTNPCLVGT